MADPVNVQYTRELRREFGYTATWLPNVEVRLGDVGILRRHRFERITTLENLGLAFETRAGAGESFMDHMTAGSTDVRIKMAGVAPAQGSILASGDAGITVEFGRRNAILFKLSGCRIASISDQHALDAAILARFRGGGWPREYSVVTETVTAERATIVISSGSSGRIELSAHADAMLDSRSLVDLDAGLRVVSARNIGTQIIGEQELTPLFRCRGIRRSVLHRAGMTARGAEPEEAPVVEELDYESFA